MVTSSNLEAFELMFAVALEKAEKVKPLISQVEAGHYRVEGSKQWYDVYCGRNQDGFFVACTCKGSLHDNPCYHGALALKTHKAIKQAEIEKRERENSLYAKPEKVSEKINGFRV